MFRTDNSVHFWRAPGLRDSPESPSLVPQWRPRDRRLCFHQEQRDL